MAVPRPGKGVCGGAKFFGSALLQPARSVCVSSERFFHSAFNISETIRDRVIVNIERRYEVISVLSNGDIFNDLDVPLTPFSRSRHF